jgi:hypothetical protein
MAQITENPARVGARNRAGNNLSTRQRFRHWPGEGPTGAFAFGLAPGRRRGHSCRRWPPCDVRDASGVEGGRAAIVFDADEQFGASGHSADSFGAGSVL